MATVDLWPDAITEDVGLTGPALILREQAEVLAQKTKNLLKAQVHGTESVKPQIEFMEHFSFYAPLINYRYDLFTLTYPIEFYPARIDCEFLDSGSIYVHDEEALLESLKKMFSNPKTIKLIQAIIVRSKQTGKYVDESNTAPKGGAWVAQGTSHG